MVFMMKYIKRVQWAKVLFLSLDKQGDEISHSQTDYKIHIDERMSFN